MPCPECGPRELAERLREASGLPAEMQGWRFDRNTLDLPHLRAVLRAAHHTIRERPNYFFTLTGGYGVGKTRVLACMVNKACTLGLPARYGTASTLLDELRDATGAGTYREAWDALVKVRVLAIDELVRYKATDFAEDRTQALLGERYARGERLLTILAFNGELTDLPPYYQSRIRDTRCQHFHITGPDMRQIIEATGDNCA